MAEKTEAKGIIHVKTSIGRHDFDLEFETATDEELENLIVTSMPLGTKMTTVSCNLIVAIAAELRGRRYQDRIENPRKRSESFAIEIAPKA